MPIDLASNEYQGLRAAGASRWGPKVALVFASSLPPSSHDALECRILSGVCSSLGEPSRAQYWGVITPVGQHKIKQLLETRLLVTRSGECRDLVSITERGSPPTSTDRKAS